MSSADVDEAAESWTGESAARMADDLHGRRGQGSRLSRFEVGIGGLSDAEELIESRGLSLPIAL